MTRRFFSGSTLEQAVMAAARHYKTEPAQLAYRQIEKRHGFLRTRKAVVISVDPELPLGGAEIAGAGDPAPAESAAAAVAEAVAPPPLGASPEPLAPTVALPAEDLPAAEAAEEHGEGPPGAAGDAPEPALEVAEPAVEVTEPAAEVAEPAPEVADEELLEAAERATQTLLRFAGIDAEATARSGAERIEIEIEGPDEAVLVVESGKGLLAIQHLLPRLLRGSVGRSSFVRVDSKGFHRRRRERLEALALKEAEAASRDGGSRTLPPMAPDERRIVHLALKDIPAVVTESRGTGLHKRVEIRPADGDGGHKDVEARHGF